MDACGNLPARRQPIATVGMALLLTVAVSAVRTVALAGERPTFSARSGLALARDAAHVWADDAELVYLENDEPVGADGTAERWGYLFHSPRSGDSRGYTLRDGEVLEAADLDFDFDAPPLPNGWLDSRAALELARRAAGQEYCRDHEGHLQTMFLIRGAFHESDPDRSTWTVVFTSADAPSLLVVVDAIKGEVVRKWKG